MRFIGITGGVGAGKSEILSYLAKKPATRVMLADEIAHRLMEPETECYHKITEAFSQEDILTPTGALDRARLAAVIFSDETKRQTLNAIVHPAVKEYVRREAERERKKGELRLLILEAALLIEEHYEEICDELWYIYSREDIREERLIKSRGYTREKIHQIFASQLLEEAYRAHCSVVIDNNGTLAQTLRQLEEVLENI